MKRKVNMNNIFEKRVNPRLQLDLSDTEESPTSESLGGTKIYKWIIQKKLFFSKPKPQKSQHLLNPYWGGQLLSSLQK